MLFFLPMQQSPVCQLQPTLDKAPCAMTSSTKLMDKDLHSIFHPEEWIGKNKTYPGHADVSLYIYNALLDTLNTPDSFQAEILPSSRLPISRFLEIRPPKEYHGLYTPNSTHWFSKSLPSNDLTFLLTWSIPPPALVDHLWSDCRQQWFDSAKSIIDPRFNNGTDCLPLWVITYWKQMQETIRIQEDWRERKEWPKEQSYSGLMALEVKRALTVFDTMSWQAPVNAFHVNIMSLQLSKFLGEDWISDDFIDMMMSQLAEKVKADPRVSENVMTRTLAFSQIITHAESKKNRNKKMDPLLCWYEEEVKKTKKMLLYFPIHTGSNHWIIGYINFKTRVFGYEHIFIIDSGSVLTRNLGDSRNGLSISPDKLMRAVGKCNHTKTFKKAWLWSSVDHSWCYGRVWYATSFFLHTSGWQASSHRIIFQD